ncbi:MAG: acetyl-CoA carboxylase biotin carboxyl carrier protein subunit [Firmicutes bacterium HGW-Firmicutes-13]|nr:MAG: acetyl-CoA carboxylase biotin carboxyl carrier protein subunit [Firmicutes bacterium HGW-Firmicutes-13]
MRKFRITVNGQTYEVEVEEVGVSPGSTAVETKAEPVKVEKTAPASEAAGEGTPVTAPMPGAILDIKVNLGDKVEEGEVVAVLEAMKMENELIAPVSGTVTSIAVSKGANVEVNDTIMTIG